MMIDLDDIDELVARMRDGDGDDEAGQQLAEMLRDRPDLRERYLRQMYLASMFREAVGEGEVCGAKSRGWIVPLVAVAAVLVVGCFLFFKSEADGEQLVARLESVEGAIWIDGKRAVTGERISLGQELSVKDGNGSVTLAYADGTRVLITGEARLILADVGHKHLEVAAGVIHADVAKQPAGHPMQIVTPNARLEILGTRFVVDAGGDATDLNVTEGRVRFTRDGGGSVEVAAGERARFSNLFDIEITELPTPPTSWLLDFEKEGEVAGARTGAPVRTDLPSGSKGAFGMTPYTLTHNGVDFHYRNMVFRDFLNGFCQVGAATHFRIKFRSNAPHWFNVFIYTIGPDKSGRMQVRKFKLPGGRLLVQRSQRDGWNTIVVPVAEFTERMQSLDYGGPPPEVGHVITAIHVSNPLPDRGVVVDEIGFEPSGSEELEHIFHGP